MAAVLDYLQGRGVTFQVIPHPAAETPAEEATAIGVDPSEVSKTLALVSGIDIVLAVVPASERLDLRLIRTAMGDEHARLATEDELRLAFPDFELGTLPPLGLMLEAAMYVDPAVMERETVVFASGRRTQSIRIRTDDLFRGDPIVVTSLTKRGKRGEDLVVEVEEPADVFDA
jgi:Ala-tRNA(Pro) deacylase